MRCSSEFPAGSLPRWQGSLVRQQTSSDRIERIRLKKAVGKPGTSSAVWVSSKPRRSRIRMLAAFVRVSCRTKHIEEAVCVPDDRGRGLEGETSRPITGREPVVELQHAGVLTDIDTAVADHETRWAEHDRERTGPVGAEGCLRALHPLFSCPAVEGTASADVSHHKRVAQQGRPGVNIAGLEGRERQPVALENQGSLSWELGRRCLQLPPRARRCRDA